MGHLDELDYAILRLLAEKPRAGTREHSRLLGIARGTVHTRVARMARDGVITNWAPTLNPRQMGYALLAFVHVQLAQGVVDSITRAMIEIPEVIEVHSIAGDGDLLCRVVARDSEHLETVVQSILSLKGVVRTRSEVALRERIAARVLPLLRSASP